MKLDHIGLATRQIEDGLAIWQDALGLEIDSTEEISEQGVRVAMLAIGKFLAKRGPGIHHVAVAVNDIHASLADFKKRGARLIDETPRVGARGCLVAFIHPAAANGVLLELVQHPMSDKL